MSQDSSNVPTKTKPGLQPFDWNINEEWRTRAFAESEARRQELGYDPITLERVRDLTPAEEAKRNEALIVQQRAEHARQASYGFRSIAEMPEPTPAAEPQAPETQEEYDARIGQAFLRRDQSYGEHGMRGPDFV